MKIAKLIARLLFPTLSACTSGSLKNPNLLVPPVTLTKAEYYHDGGSIGGALRDSRGQQFEFFFADGFDSIPGAVYIGHAPWREIPLMRARFKDWPVEDLYKLIERTVHEQFVWDNGSKTLRLKKADPIPGVGEYDLMSANVLLSHVESKLHRKKSYAR